MGGLSWLTLSMPASFTALHPFASCVFAHQAAQISAVKPAAGCGPSPADKLDVARRHPT
jgi:hypothetical protein